MSRAGHAQCARCGAYIEWGVTTNGRRAPFDLGTHTDGTYVATTDEHGHERMRRVGRHGANAQTLHRHHGDSCPYPTPRHARKAPR